MRVKMEWNNMQPNITLIHSYPLTGIFPFTLVRKHILIQLDKVRT